MLIALFFTDLCLSISF